MAPEHRRVTADPVRSLPVNVRATHPLSVAIITKNEENNIMRCLESVRWADEIVVADSGSTDSTLDVCRRFDCRIVETDWLGFGPTKQLAAESASHDWVLSVDADEEVTDRLKEAIHQVLAKPQCKAYRIKRTSFYLGKMIRHCGWNRDYPVRLFHRAYAHWNDKSVHESLVVAGPLGTLEAPLLHYTYPTIESHVERMNRYSELCAQELLGRGGSCLIPSAVLRGMAKFLKMYVLQTGFLDGGAGFVLSYNSAVGVYLKYLKLWKRTR
jgi:glycosyltransferase involved in cell wall biosynthesis